MNFKPRSLRQIAELICGNSVAGKTDYFKYRSSMYLTQFFEDCDMDYTHNGSTRWSWVVEKLEDILTGPQPNATTPPAGFSRVIQVLMDQGDALNEGPERPEALALLNAALTREGYEAFYAADKKCYLRHLATNTVAEASPNPHRPFSKAELLKREQLTAYLAKASEDELIEEVLLPLFRQQGFHRVTAAGHKDKALEYGKDIWMKYVLPTQHVLYFGIQVKKGKLDSSGMTKGSNANISEIYNQTLMMLGHEIFDPETSKRALVDHCFIVAGGEITKAARNWLGGKLDASKRSQIMFMDKDDILNLFTVSNVPLPAAALPPQPEATLDDEIPF